MAILHHVVCISIGIDVWLQQHDLVTGLSERRINMQSVTLCEMHKNCVLYLNGP